MMTRPLRVSSGEPLIIDSSVAFKWFDPVEPGAADAVDLLRAHQRDEVALIAPAHLPLEVVNALISRRVGAEDIELAVAFLADADLLIVPVDNELLVNAARIASEERIPLYDAAFIALAARLDAELVTADRRQASTKACEVRLIG